MSLEVKKGFGMDKAYHYFCDVTDVHDADTFTVTVDKGFAEEWKKRHVRLFGIDAPELRTSEGKEARRFVAERIGWKRILIRSIKPIDFDDDFARILADVFYEGPNGEEISLIHELVKHGYYKPDSKWNTRVPEVLRELEEMK